MVSENILYHHEPNARPHYTILMGFRYQIQEGDPVFNTEKLRVLYNTLKRKMVTQNKQIFALGKVIILLMKYYVPKNSNEFQTLDDIHNALDALWSKVGELNRQVSILYGEDKDNMYSQAYDKNHKIGNEYKNTISLPVNLMDYNEMVLALQVKTREYMEQKAEEIISAYGGIQAELNSIEHEIGVISEKIRQIRSKYSVKF